MRPKRLIGELPDTIDTCYGAIPGGKRGPHPAGGKAFRIISGKFKDNIFLVYDWQINDYNGVHWSKAEGDEAAASYAFRCGFERLPFDNEAVCGYITLVKVIIHQSQLGEEVTL